MITVGLDFGTHQTKICHERVEEGIAVYDVFRFRGNGGESLTSPSLLRLRADGRLRYGHDAVADDSGGRVAAYFKQKTFLWSLGGSERAEAERWSILYLASVIFELDAFFGTSRYVVHMGMPTDADPSHYDFCKRQAVKVMASAMLLARMVFKGNQDDYLRASYGQLVDYVSAVLQTVERNLREVQKKLAILVFPEAYVALIPLIGDRKLPDVGPSLFVDIGGGTVDISFFTNQMDDAAGCNRPRLYHYSSVPYGLNAITGQDPERCHNVEVRQTQITPRQVDRFRETLASAVDEMLQTLGQKYKETGRELLMPFSNLCAQMLEGRPVCYSGGGSMFRDLRIAVARRGNGVVYDFSDVKVVSSLIDHAKLYVDDGMFPVLATAFALSHESIRSKGNGGMGSDAIHLAPVSMLFEGVRMPRTPIVGKGARWERKKKWNW